MANDLTKPPSGTSPGKPAELGRAEVDALFRRLAGMYGDKWITLWMDVPLDEVKRVWIEELRGVTVEMARLAIHAMDSPFPPTLPEFRELCRKFRPRGVPAAIQLAAPPGRRATDETFAKLREQLRQGKPVE